MDNQMNQYNNGNGYRNDCGNGQGGNNGNGNGGGNQSPWRNNWIYYVLAGVIGLVIFFLVK